MSWAQNVGKLCRHLHCIHVLCVCLLQWVLRELQLLPSWCAAALGSDHTEQRLLPGDWTGTDGENHSHHHLTHIPYCWTLPVGQMSFSTSLSAEISVKSWWKVKRSCVSFCTPCNLYHSIVLLESVLQAFRQLDYGEVVSNDWFCQRVAVTQLFINTPLHAAYVLNKSNLPQRTC